MTFKRLFSALAGLLVLCGSNLHAGDSASYADLGFSPDGGFYMFAQYGVRTDNLKPWADMFIVDVRQNEFIRGGRISYTHDKPIDAGQDGSGALYRLIAQTANLAESHHITYPNQGQPLYIALEGDPAYDGGTVVFRDFISGVSYNANLVETITGSGETLRSSFFIRLEYSENDGAEKTFVIGTPDLRRPLIASYRIKKVLIDPSGGSLIFVIEMKRETNDGYEIRYMVETLRL
jgi:predicted secreted protein